MGRTTSIAANLQTKIFIKKFNNFSFALKIIQKSVFVDLLTFDQTY
jgi:hypothetical protein